MPGIIHFCTRIAQPHAHFIKGRRHGRFLQARAQIHQAIARREREVASQIQNLRGQLVFTGCDYLCGSRRRRRAQVCRQICDSKIRLVAHGRDNRNPRVANRARQLFENITRQRLEHFRVNAHYALACIEDELSVARSMQHLLKMRPTAILIASTTAPAGPEDIIGRAMVRIGCHIERFLAPVEPGNLLLMAYKDDVPLVSAPGCFRSAKPNVVDLILPPMLARYRVSGWEVACLGHGGLLA